MPYVECDEYSIYKMLNEGLLSTYLLLLTYLCNAYEFNEGLCSLSLNNKTSYYTINTLIIIILDNCPLEGECLVDLPISISLS